MNHMKIKPPIGMTIFDLIKREGYYYVDKTKYIKVIEELDSKYQIL